MSRFKVAALAGLLILGFFILLFVIRTRDNERSLEVVGDYATTSVPSTHIDTVLKWSFRSDHKVRIGDETVPEAVIEGRWEITPDETVRVQFITLGGQDVKSVPRTSDTRLVWIFRPVAVLGRQIKSMKSDDGKMILSRT